MVQPHSQQPYYDLPPRILVDTVKDFAHSMLNSNVILCSPQENMPQTPPFAAMFDSSGYNRNLYQSKEDSCGGLYYHDNNLLSGSLEALIQHLVPTVDYYPDVSLGHFQIKLAWLS